MMKSAKKVLCINLVIALVVTGVRVYFTEFFGYGIGPILVDSVAFLLVLILTVVTYVRTGRDWRTLLFFLPLIVVTFMPILFLVATFAAWSFGGFSP
jgi:hypothetical protein